MPQGNGSVCPVKKSLGNLLKWILLASLSNNAFGREVQSGHASPPLFSPPLFHFLQSGGQLVTNSNTWFILSSSIKSLDLETFLKDSRIKGYALWMTITSFHRSMQTTEKRQGKGWITSWFSYYQIKLKVSKCTLGTKVEQNTKQISLEDLSINIFPSLYYKQSQLFAQPVAQQNRQRMAQSQKYFENWNTQETIQTFQEPIKIHRASTYCTAGPFPLTNTRDRLHISLCKREHLVVHALSGLLDKLLWNLHILSCIFVCFFCALYGPTKLSWLTTAILGKMLQ